MNYTENYQLPQWEETDRVLRTDFNDAMAKVDEGIAENKKNIPVVKLREFILSEDATQYSLDLTNLNVANYAGIRLAVHGLGAIGWTGFRINSVSTNYESYSAGSTGGSSTLTLIPVASYGDYFGFVELYPMNDWTLFFVNSMQFETDDVTGIWRKGIQRTVAYEDIQTLEMACSREDGILTQGTTVTLYGIVV